MCIVNPDSLTINAGKEATLFLHWLYAAQRLDAHITVIIEDADKETFTVSFSKPYNRNRHLYEQASRYIKSNY